MANSYDIGDRVRMTATVVTSGGVAADPTEVTFKVQDPSGNEATYLYSMGLVTRTSAGVYYLEVTVDEAGTWYYRANGTGAVIAADEEYFYVRESQF